MIGCGGISTAEDAIEYMLAGATAVQVGTATFLQPTAMTTIIEDLKVFCVHREISRVRDLIRSVVIEEADEPDVAWLDPVPMNASLIQKRHVFSGDSRDRDLAENMFTLLQERTWDGIGITRQAYSERETLALDIVEEKARELGLETERDAGGPI